MMPTLAWPGERMPGQFGPTSRVCGWSRRSTLNTRSSSCAGMPSVIATTSATSTCAASRIESVAKRGGTKIIAVLGCACSTACAQLSNTGIPSRSCPHLPGVTPATTLVPERRLLSVWKDPSRPVMPATARRVFSSTRTDISRASCWRLHGAAGGERDDHLCSFVHRARGVHVWPRRLGPEFAPLYVVGAVQAHDERHVGFDLAERRDQPLGDLVAARDAAEDVDQHRLHRVV